jgi:SAM-dependent methyltransferase
MTRTIDYRQVTSFWERAARAAGPCADCAAALSEGRITPSAHAYCRRGQLDQFVEMVGPLPPSASVLDLGCGPGLFSLELAPRVASIAGIDLAPAFVDAARAEAARRGVRHARFDVGSAVDGVPDGSFDLVILSGVLPYLGDADLPRVLTAVRTAVSNQGSVYVRVSCASGRPWQRSGRYAAIYRTSATYEKLFRAAGFRVSRSGPDRFYTYYDLLIGYLALARVLTLGRLRHLPVREDALLQTIIRGGSLTLEMPRRVLAVLPTPLPHSRSFLLRPDVGAE